MKSTEQIATTPCCEQKIFDPLVSEPSVGIEKYLSPKKKDVAKAQDDEVWKKGKDSKGRPFYFNSITGESRWTDPRIAERKNNVGYDCTVHVSCLN